MILSGYGHTQSSKFDHGTLQHDTSNMHAPRRRYVDVFTNRFCRTTPSPHISLLHEAFLRNLGRFCEADRVLVDHRRQLLPTIPSYTATFWSVTISFRSVDGAACGAPNLIDKCSRKHRSIGTRKQAMPLKYKLNAAE